MSSCCAAGALAGLSRSQLLFLEASPNALLAVPEHNKEAVSMRKAPARLKTPFFSLRCASLWREKKSFLVFSGFLLAKKNSTSFFFVLDIKKIS